VVLDDIHESIGFQNSSVVTLKSRLDSLHHYYDSIKQERLNKTIFTLTIISAVFLPMNLLVGFFGMNTQGLFFSEDPLGTMNVIYLLVGISFLTLGGLKLIKTADHYLLRYLLGKFDFYKRISKRFEEMEHRLKGD
jgi:magnesium transporter